MRSRRLKVKFSGSDRDDSDRPHVVKINISGWNVVVTLILGYFLFAAITAGFTLSSVSYLLLVGVLTIFEPLGSRLVHWIRQRREGDRVAGTDRLLRASSDLLPRDVRERYLDEWLDDLQCRREQGHRVWLAAVWIVLRSVLPLTVRGRREQNRRKIRRTPVHYELALGRKEQSMEATTNFTPLTSTQRTIDVTTMVVLMVAMSYMFGGLRVHGGNFTVELRTLATTLWLLCIAFYFYIPRILGQETFSKQLSRRFAK
jgi:hypothetical protein